MNILNSFRIFLILMLMLIVSSCSSTNSSLQSTPAEAIPQPVVPKPVISDDKELKVLNEQSQKIIASTKKEQVATDDHKFAPNDQITIQVWLRDRITQFKGYPFQQVVPPSGEIFIPDVGAVTVTGKTPAELKVLVSSHFVKTLRDPTILVERIRKIEPVVTPPPSPATGWTQTADRQASQLIPHIIIMGWVGEPGVYPIEPGLRIREALALTGKIDENGDYKRIYLVRGSVKNPQVMRINMNKILRGEDLNSNILLQPNDAIYVAPIKMWTAYDYIRTILMPISAVRDAVWVGSNALITN
jgi:protein involved in polysaccharide export with SLBB domain